MTTAIQT